MRDGPGNANQPSSAASRRHPLSLADRSFRMLGGCLNLLVLARGRRSVRQPAASRLASDADRGRCWSRSRRRPTPPTWCRACCTGPSTPGSPRPRVPSTGWCRSSGNTTSNRMRSSPSGSPPTPGCCPGSAAREPFALLAVSRLFPHHPAVVAGLCLAAVVFSIDVSLMFEYHKWGHRQRRGRPVRFAPALRAAAVAAASPAPPSRCARQPLLPDQRHGRPDARARSGCSAAWSGSSPR